jgi:hypothetical protein
MNRSIIPLLVWVLTAACGVGASSSEGDKLRTQLELSQSNAACASYADAAKCSANAACQWLVYPTPPGAPVLAACATKWLPPLTGCPAHADAAACQADPSCQWTALPTSPGGPIYSCFEKSPPPNACASYADGASCQKDLACLWLGAATSPGLDVCVPR